MLGSAFFRGQYEKHFCKIILNSDQAFMRRRYFTSTALVTHIFGGVESFVLFW